MPINTPHMLAPLSLEMAELKELLAAEQPELELLRVHAEAIKRECSVRTCVDTIARHEAIVGLAPGGKTLEARRAAVQFYLNARLLITPAYMVELLADVLQCHCQMAEEPAKYRFTVDIDGEDHSPNMTEAARYVKLLKPAHLEANLRYRQREQGNVQIAARAGIGLFLKVKPYQPENVRAEGAVQMAMFVKGAQRLQIFPKGD